MSILDETENSIEVENNPAPEVNLTTGEPKKRRGRPPGSKNKPREETLAPNLEGAIKGIFFVCALIAKWLGYEQTEDLTDSEVKEGARSFTPIAQKLPWIATLATYIGPPIWLYMTISRKFTKRAQNGNGNADSDSPGSGTRGEAALAPDRETATG